MVERNRDVWGERERESGSMLVLRKEGEEDDDEESLA